MSQKSQPRATKPSRNESVDPKKNTTEEKKHERSLHVAILKQMVTLTTSGFGVVAALAWNNVIQEVVNTYIKPYIPNIGLLSLLFYAILVTVLTVTVTINLTRIINFLERPKG